MEWKQFDNVLLNVTIYVQCYTAEINRRILHIDRSVCMGGDVNLGTNTCTDICVMPLFWFTIQLISFYWMFPKENLYLLSDIAHWSQCLYWWKRNLKELGLVTNTCTGICVMPLSRIITKQLISFYWMFPKENPNLSLGRLAILCWNISRHSDSKGYIICEKF